MIFPIPGFEDLPRYDYETVDCPACGGNGQIGPISICLEDESYDPYMFGWCTQCEHQWIHLLSETEVKQLRELDKDE